MYVCFLSVKVFEHLYEFVFWTLECMFLLWRHTLPSSNHFRCESLFNWTRAKIWGLLWGHVVKALFELTLCPHLDALHVTWFTIWALQHSSMQLTRISALHWGFFNWTLVLSTPPNESILPLLTLRIIPYLVGLWRDLRLKMRYR